MFMENSSGSRPASTTSSGTQAAQSSCPDTNGTLPSCAGLAVPYVPFQKNNPQKYAQSEALSNGTLFPGLNLPFHLKVQAGEQCTIAQRLSLGIALDTVLLEGYIGHCKSRT